MASDLPGDEKIYVSLKDIVPQTGSRCKGEFEKRGGVEHFNEIAHSAMKSSLRSDEICFADEIKSVPAPDGVGFHH